MSYDHSCDTAKYPLEAPGELLARTLATAKAIDKLTGTGPTKLVSPSGATSSHAAPYNFQPTYEGMKLTCKRFAHGNFEHESARGMKNDPVYDNQNWRQAYKARDVSFFRERTGHAVEHLIDEAHGKDDQDPGGNLGAVGWLVDIAAFVRKNDPYLWACVQGKFDINSIDDEESFVNRWNKTHSTLIVVRNPNYQCAGPGNYNKASDD